MIHGKELISDSKLYLIILQSLKTRFIIIFHHNRLTIFIILIKNLISSKKTKIPYKFRVKTSYLIEN